MKKRKTGDEFHSTDKTITRAVTLHVSPLHYHIDHLLLLWNSLPDYITSASSLTASWQKLKTHFFGSHICPVIVM